ncbi:MAG: hypothetical protein JO053_09690 [Acidobacteria bacterium]|nr:hypothetical protein [Acidobacteriota bacterium]
MLGTDSTELYFVIAMMILILIVCGIAVFAFFRTYKKEMRERAEREAVKMQQKEQEPRSQAAH